MTILEKHRAIYTIDSELSNSACTHGNKYMNINMITSAPHL